MKVSGTNLKCSFDSNYNGFLVMNGSLQSNGSAVLMTMLISYTVYQNYNKNNGKCGAFKTEWLSFLGICVYS